MTTEYSTEKVTELIARSGYVDGLWGKDEIFNHMLALTRALASEHKRAEEAQWAAGVVGDVSRETHGALQDAQAENAELRAVIAELGEVAKDCPSITTVDRILSRIPEHDDKETA